MKMSLISLLGKQNGLRTFLFNGFGDQSIIDQVCECKNSRCKQSQARQA